MTPFIKDALSKEAHLAPLVIIVHHQAKTYFFFQDLLLKLIFTDGFIDSAGFYPFVLGCFCGSNSAFHQVERREDPVQSLVLGSTRPQSTCFLLLFVMKRRDGADLCHVGFPCVKNKPRNSQRAAAD